MIAGDQASICIVNLGEGKSTDKCHSAKSRVRVSNAIHDRTLSLNTTAFESSSSKFILLAFAP